MVNLKELEQQIARIDGLLQEAYRENNKEDVILFAGLMAKLYARKKEAKEEPKALKAWKNICNDSAYLEAMLESRILARDEMHAMKD